MKMKKSILAASVTVLTGLAVIGGNHLLVSNVLASDFERDAKINISEANSTESIENPGVGMYSGSGGAVFMSALGGAARVKPNAEIAAETVTAAVTEAMPNAEQNNRNILAVPEGGEMDTEEATQTAIDVLKQELAFSDGDIAKFDISLRNSMFAEQPSEVAGKLLWIAAFTPVNADDFPLIESYSVQFDDGLERPARVVVTNKWKDGTPSEDEIGEEEATERVINALAGKYAFSDEVLARFTVTAKYYEITPDAPGKHAWWINLYPTVMDDYSEIGAYWGYIDASSGDMLQLNSAVDAKG